MPKSRSKAGSKSRSKAGSKAGSKAPSKSNTGLNFGEGGVNFNGYFSNLEGNNARRRNAEAEERREEYWRNHPHLQLKENFGYGRYKNHHHPGNEANISAAGHNLFGHLAGPAVAWPADPPYHLQSNTRSNLNRALAFGIGKKKTSIVNGTTRSGRNLFRKTFKNVKQSRKSLSKMGVPYKSQLLQQVEKQLKQTPFKIDI